MGITEGTVASNPTIYYEVPTNAAGPGMNSLLPPPKRGFVAPVIFGLARYAALWALQIIISYEAPLLGGQLNHAIEILKNRKGPWCG